MRGPRRARRPPAAGRREPVAGVRPRRQRPRPSKGPSKRVDHAAQPGAGDGASLAAATDRCQPDAPARPRRCRVPSRPAGRMASPARARRAKADDSRPRAYRRRGPQGETVADREARRSARPTSTPRPGDARRCVLPDGRVQAGGSLPSRDAMLFSEIRVISLGHHWSQWSLVHNLTRSRSSCRDDHAD